MASAYSSSHQNHPCNFGHSSLDSYYNCNSTEEVGQHLLAKFIQIFMGQYGKAGKTQHLGWETQHQLKSKEFTCSLWSTKTGAQEIGPFPAAFISSIWLSASLLASWGLLTAQEDVLQSTYKGNRGLSWLLSGRGRSCVRCAPQRNKQGFPFKSQIESLVI